MKKYQAILFDLDGTLLDTLTDLANAVNHTLNLLLEPPRTHSEIRSFLGSGVPTLLYKSLTDKNLHQNAVKLFMSYYDKHKNDNTKPYGDIILLLTILNKTDLKLAIVSNKAHDAVITLNDKIFNGLIPYPYGSVNNLPFKPDRALIDKCLKDLNLESKDCLYVGDTEIDYQTAKNANLDFLAVSWGFRDKEFLLELKPKYLIDKPLELLKIIGVAYESN